MNNIWVFGDSFSEDVRNVPHRAAGRWEYINQYLNGIPYDSWSTLLSSKLGYNLFNKAANGGNHFDYMGSGNSNQALFNNLYFFSSQFKKNDIVILGFTDIVRFEWVIEDGTSYSVLPNLYPPMQNKNLKIVFDETLIQRNNDYYYEELINKCNILDSLSKSVGFKVIYWSWNNGPERFILKNNLSKENWILLYEEPNSYDELIRKYGGNNIKLITNGLIDDSHLSDLGEIAQYKLFIDRINLM